MPPRSYFHARRLLQAGAAADALSILDTLAADNDGIAEFNHVRGIAQYRAGLGSEAAESLTRAVQLSPDSALYGEDLAVVLAEASAAKSATPPPQT